LREILGFIGGAEFLPKKADERGRFLAVKIPKCGIIEDLALAVIKLFGPPTAIERQHHGAAAGRSAGSVVSWRDRSDPCDWLWSIRRAYVHSGRRPKPDVGNLTDDRRMRLYRQAGWTYAHATRPQLPVTELSVGVSMPHSRLVHGNGAKLRVCTNYASVNNACSIKYDTFTRTVTDK